jgi:glutathione synthase/RimK-type ligase-like ATP-grasp enzyme
MRKRRIAFATCSKVPDLYEDDQSALPALHALGFEIEPAVWDSEKVDWGRYDAIVIRSTWFYWLDYQAFLNWISKIDRLGIPVLNPPSILRENSRKTYLRRIESRGVPILPTCWIENGNRETLSQTLARHGWADAVLKPSVSGGAYRTYRLSQAAAENFENQLSEILVDSEAMIQPLASTVLSEGELSFLFYGGRFSHAAVKKGPEGEFRIQRVYGGTVSPYAPTANETEQAQKALQAYADPESLLYARVDFVRDPQSSSRLLLMELEATEPNLFFLHDQANPGAAMRFAKALDSRLGANTRAATGGPCSSVS